MPLALFMYAYLPTELGLGGLLPRTQITPEEFATVQLLNLIGVVSLLGGCLVGSRGWQKNIAIPKRDPAMATRAMWAAIALGSAGLLAYVVTLDNVGGFVEAYSVVKGGGTADSGWVRDTITWGVPAIALLSVSVALDNRQRDRSVILAAAFAIPLATQGILASRRGPMFMTVSTIVASWFLGRRTRPRLVAFASGALALGAVLMGLATFREEFFLGSALFERPGESLQRMFDGYSEKRAEIQARTLGGNEFVFGSNLALSFLESGDHYWGGRIAVLTFIRPIPRQWWPTKYQDTGFGESIEDAVYGRGGALRTEATLGAAPGIVADTFAEFRWGAFAILFAFGLLYGRAWRQAVAGHGFAQVVYICLVSVSVFLVTQSMEAAVFRSLFFLVPAWILWNLVVETRWMRRHVVGGQRAMAWSPSLSETGSSR